MSWINSQFVDSAGNVITSNKIAKGNNWQLNVGQGEKAFDVTGLIAAGVGAGGDFLVNSSNEYQNTGDFYKDTLLKGIYGDSSQGNLMQIVDNISGKSKNNALQAINDNTYRNTGVLGSNQDLINSFNSINSPVELEKRGAGSIAGTIGGSFLKGAASGFAAGSAIPGIGNIAGAIGGAVLGLAGGIGSSINGNKYEKIKKAQELAYNNSLNNFNTQVLNTTKQNNLNSLVNMTALGGQLNYNIDDKYLANDYMSKLNNRVYKPQFDSMNYFAMGGMPDFNEFNTGGTHEQNPNGGIPQGMDKQGIMNTVEQGETKTTTPEGDYIFSDRLKLSKEECKQLGVPKDSTYAEASKILRKEYDEMPNDDIARKGWEQSRDMLIQSQEMQKQEIALKEARKQGLNSPKMQRIESQVMQDMYYNENPQEEALLQQGMNPNIQQAFGGSIKQMFDGGPTGEKTDTQDGPWFISEFPLRTNWSASNNYFTPIVTIDPSISRNKIVTPIGVVNTNTKVQKDQDYIKSKIRERNNSENNKFTFNPENLKYAPIMANIAGLAQNLFTPEDYSMPNRLQQEINVLPRVSVPKNTNYMTYNPVDINRYTNQYNAQTAAQRNAIMNTSNPNRNAALASAIYNTNIGYGDLVQAIEAQNAKEKQAVQQFNAGIDQQNISNQLQADNINQNYEQMRINGIMQELAMRDAIQTARANAIQSNLKGLTDNLSGIAQQAENRRMFDVYMDGQGHELTMLQRLANGENINDLISEWTAGQDENYRKEFIDRLKKNPRYKNYVGQIK